jgi:hypothetical protein
MTEDVLNSEPTGLYRQIMALLLELPLREHDDSRGESQYPDRATIAHKIEALLRPAPARAEDQ